MSSGPDDIMGLKEAGEYLRIKERTLYSLIKQKKVPAVKVGRQWRLKRSRLEAMFEQTENP